MSWREASRVIEREKFIFELIGTERSFAEVCRTFGISRPTGYKWVERYDREGPEGLKDRSHARRHHPNQVEEQLVEAVLRCRRETRVGPKKIRELLVVGHPALKVPAAS